MTVLADSPTRHRAGVFRRALRREAGRLRDRRRLLAMAILIVVGGLLAAAIVARGDPAGADARAYWAAVRIWLNGGDPYHPAGPFLPYVYAPWMLPLFAPWALLPWDVAWVVWRGSSIILLLWTIDWAYRRRPLATAVAFLLLFFPIGANLDTGNIDLFLVFMLWGAQSAGPRLAGLLWAIATWMKWVPGLFLLILMPRSRLWGLIWLAVAGLLSLATLPLTLVQLQALIGFGARPIRLDYLVLLWALVPWWWGNPDRLWFLRPSRWAGIAASFRALVRRLRDAWRSDPAVAWSRVQRGTRLRVRAYLGLEGR
ncbi:MAG TPA: glycosyltransferase family 87 protein [Candidatus Limnocylindrales bacterium]